MHQKHYSQMLRYFKRKYFLKSIARTSKFMLIGNETASHTGSL